MHHRDKGKLLRRTLIVFVIVSVLGIGTLFLYDPFAFGNLGSTYETQSIEYRNKTNREITIEFQMRDIGARGYNRRVVKITPGIFFDSTEEIDTTRMDKTQWVRVREDVNELGLKGG